MRLSDGEESEPPASPTHSCSVEIGANDLAIQAAESRQLALVEHRQPFGCLSPTLQPEQQQERKRQKLAVRRNEVLEAQRRWGRSTISDHVPDLHSIIEVFAMATGAAQALLFMPFFPFRLAVNFLPDIHGI